MAVAARVGEMPVMRRGTSVTLGIPSVLVA